MNTIPDCTTDQVASKDHATHADAPARFVNRNMNRIWRHHRLLATLLRPFRRVLRPLLVWLRQEHVYIQSDQPGAPPVGLNLRQFGWESIALGILLAPLAFIMLLPLLIIIFPVAVCIGLFGIAAAAVQTDADDVDHHSLTWHALHS